MRKAMKRQRRASERERSFGRMLASRKDRAYKVRSIDEILSTARFNTPLVDWIIKAQGDKCFYCGEAFEKYTKDHFFPKSKGYGLVGNTVIACVECNQAKADRLPTNDEQDRFDKIYDNTLKEGG